jgi:hypothetical protein
MSLFDYVPGISSGGQSRKRSRFITVPIAITSIATAFAAGRISNRFRPNDRQED